MSEMMKKPQTPMSESRKDMEVVCLVITLLGHNLFAWLKNFSARMVREYGFAAEFLIPDGQTKGEYKVFPAPPFPEPTGNLTLDKAARQLWQSKSNLRDKQQADMEAKYPQIFQEMLDCISDEGKFQLGKSGLFRAAQYDIGTRRVC